MKSHHDIKISFQVRGQRFEAVGFLAPGEGPLDADEAFRRVEKRPGLLDHEKYFFEEKYEDGFALNNAPGLPHELRGFRLITGHTADTIVFWNTIPGSKEYYWDHDVIWRKIWAVKMGARYLVVRRGER